MTADAYAATHRVPTAGLQAWSTPDASQAPAANLAPNLDVQLLRWWGEWAEIRCSNGWTAWVGGRQLIPNDQYASQPTPLATVQQRVKDVPLPAGVSPLAAGGAALMVLGSFLPWLSIDVFGSSVTANSWDVPFLYLATGENTLSGLDIGLILLVAAVAVVAIPLLTKRPLDTSVLLGIGILAVATAALYFLRVSVLDDSDGAGVGFGTLVAAAGGALLVVAFQQAQRGIGKGGWAQ